MILLLSFSSGFPVKKESKIDPDFVPTNVVIGMAACIKADQFESLMEIKSDRFGVAGLGKNESIISGDFENGFIIEGVYHNDFVATQRILSFGASCTVYEPQDFKEHIVELLRKMRNTYNG